MLHSDWEDDINKIFAGAGELRSQSLQSITLTRAQIRTMMRIIGT